MKTRRLKPGEPSSLKRLAILSDLSGDKRDFLGSIERDPEGNFWAVELVFARHHPSAVVRRIERPMKEKDAKLTLANHKRLSAAVREAFRKEGN